MREGRVRSTRGGVKNISNSTDVKALPTPFRPSGAASPQGGSKSAVTYMSNIFLVGKFRNDKIHNFNP